MNDLIVANVDKARTLLAAARDASDAKRVADLARAAEVYARRQKLTDEVISYAHAIRVDAMTLMGEFLKATPKAKGTKGQLVGRGVIGGSQSEPPISRAPSYASAGIDKKEAMVSQALAEVQETEPALHERIRRGEATPKAAVAAVRKKREAAEREEVETKLVQAADPQADLFRIDHGDCLSWFADQPEDSINLVFGSPPYEQARLYLEDGSDPGIARDTDEWVAWMVDVYKAALRCCTGLVAFVVEGNTKNYRWSAGPALLMAALHQEGIHLRKPPIYRRVGIPGSGGPDWLRNDYEFIICATRGGKLPWSDNTAMGSPCAYEPGGDPSHRTRDGSRVNGTGYASMEDRNNLGPHRARQQAGRVYQPPEIANPGNVIHCQAGGGNMGDPLAHHNEAPFPESLAEFFVKSFCPPNGVVCDPFSGSGTTGAMAVVNGRRFVGCDLRQSQVNLSRKRICNAQPLLPVMRTSS